MLIMMLCLGIAVSAGENEEAGPNKLSGDSDQGRIILISTKPFGARIIFDGSPVTGSTPLVIEYPAVGEHRIEFLMTGHEVSELSLNIESNSVTVIETILSPNGLTLFLQDGVASSADGSPLPAGGYSFDPGSYNFGTLNGEPQLTPVYPNQQWIDGLNIAIPVVTAFAAGLMVSEAVNPRTNGKVSPFTISVLVSDLILVGANIGLHVHRSKWQKSRELDSASATPPWADEDFRRAEELLESGKLNEARILFDRFAMIYPLDERTPEALYRSARLAYLQGNYSECSDHLSLLLEKYPVPALWDRSWRLRAELAFREERIEEGLAALDMIFNLDDSIDMESVALRRAAILSDLAGTSE